MSDKPPVEFSIQAVLCVNGLSLSPLRFYGESSESTLVVRMAVPGETADDPALVSVVIGSLLDAIRAELLRVYCGASEGKS